MHGADYYNNMSHFLQIHSTGNAHIFAVKHLSVWYTATSVCTILKARYSQLLMHNCNRITLPLQIKITVR